MNPNQMTRSDRIELERALFWLHNFTGAKSLVGELAMINGRSFEVTGLHMDEHLNISVELVDTRTRTCHSIDARTLLEDWLYLSSLSTHQLLERAVQSGIITVDEDQVTYWKGNSYYIMKIK